MECEILIAKAALLVVYTSKLLNNYWVNARYRIHGAEY